MPGTQHLVWNFTDADWKFNNTDAFLGNSTNVDGFCSWNATKADGFGTLQRGIPRNLTLQTVSQCPLQLSSSLLQEGSPLRTDNRVYV